MRMGWVMWDECLVCLSSFDVSHSEKRYMSLTLWIVQMIHLTLWVVERLRRTLWVALKTFNIVPQRNERALQRERDVGYLWDTMILIVYTYWIIYTVLSGQDHRITQLVLFSMAFHGT